MFWEYMLKGLCVGGWIIGLLTSLAVFFLLVWGLIHLGVIAAGGKDDETERSGQHVRKDQQL